MGLNNKEVFRAQIQDTGKGNGDANLFRAFLDRIELRRVVINDRTALPKGSLPCRGLATTR